MRDEFRNSIKEGAIRGYEDYGILPSLTLAQAILESGGESRSFPKRQIIAGEISLMIPPMNEPTAISMEVNIVKQINMTAVTFACLKRPLFCLGLLLNSFRRSSFRKYNREIPQNNTVPTSSIVSPSAGINLARAYL